MSVDRRALIPRPETELLVDLALEEIDKFLQKSGTAGQQPRSRTEGGPAAGMVRAPRVLDLGVGSGAIFFSLAVERPRIDLMGADLSEEVLELARENGRRLGVDTGGKLYRSDLFAGLEQNRKWDLVVCNPPYVGREELGGLEPEVRDWEPRDALVGGPTGREFPSRVLVETRARMHPGGALVMEIGAGQGELLAAAARSSGWKRAELRKDYTGVKRFLLAHVE